MAVIAQTQALGEVVELAMSGGARCERKARADRGHAARPRTSRRTSRRPVRVESTTLRVLSAGSKSRRFRSVGPFSTKRST